MKSREVKLFFLQLSDEFWDEPGVALLMGMPSGNDMLITLMRLMTKAVRTGGCIKLTGFVDMADELAAILRVDKKMVVMTINMSQSLGLIQVQVGDDRPTAILIPMIDGMTRKVTQGAIEKRAERADKKAIAAAEKAISRQEAIDIARSFWDADTRTYDMDRWAAEKDQYGAAAQKAVENVMAE